MNKFKDYQDKIGVARSNSGKNYNTDIQRERDLNDEDLLSADETSEQPSEKLSPTHPYPRYQLNMT